MVNILHNDVAKTISNHINRTGKKSEDSLMRLATGQRVVSFGDDTASSTMASRLGLEVQSLSKAALNATQASSMLNMTDSTLSWDNDVMVQLNGLAAQAASGHISAGERSMLNQTFQALKREINRVAATTEFNGINLLSGTSLAETAVPMATVTDSNILSGSMGVGEQPVQGISYTFDNAGAGGAFEVTYKAASQNCNQGGVLTVRNLSNDSTQILNIATPDQGQQNTYRIDAFDMSVKVDATFTASNSFVYSTNTVDNAGVGKYLPNSSATANDNIKIVNLKGKVDDIVAVTSADGLSTVYALDTITFTPEGGTSPDPTNVVFSLPVRSPGSPSFISQSLDLTTVGRKTINLSRQREENGMVTTDHIAIDMVVTQPFTSTDLEAGNAKTSSRIVLGQLKNLVVETSSAQTLSQNNFSFFVGSGASETPKDNMFTFSLTPVTTQSLGIDTLSIDTQENAQAALLGIHSGINSLNSVREHVGASQKIIEMIASSIDIEIENNEAAASSLMSVDFAKEVSDLSNTTIVVQAGYSALNRSIQLAENALALLRA